MKSFMDYNSEESRVISLCRITRRDGFLAAIKHHDIGQDELTRMLAEPRFFNLVKRVCAENDVELDDGPLG